MYKNQFDVIIIGGGINGVGVARDCCLRGLSTALVEAEDFASGATGASTGLIHGGPRYLESNIETTHLSCVDSGFIQKLAPQLLFRVPFMVPWRKGSGIFPEMIETFFAIYDKYSALKNGKPHVRLTRNDCLALEPGLNPNVDGAVTFDEWGVNTFRLTYLNLLDATRNGLEVFNHTEVTEFLLTEGDVRCAHGVKARKRDGEIIELRGRIVVNLTGPWATQVGKLAGVKIDIRPTKGLHLVLDRRYTNVAITCDAIDGRNHMFILPHESTTLVGATDDDYFGDPRHIPVSEDEVFYLMDAAADVLPALRNARVVRVFAGVRPTLYSRGEYESDLSRAHKIIDHEKEDRLAGLITMIGGKLAAYRIMSQECTDLIARKLGNKEKCTTASRPLPGAEQAEPEAISASARRWSMLETAVARLHYRHGSAYESILQTGYEKLGRLASTHACACEPVTFAELLHSLTTEACETLNDVRRRTRLGMGPCSGTGCAINGANWLAKTHSLSARGWHKELTAFLQKRYQGRRGALGWKDTAKQEEYQRSLMSISGSIGKDMYPEGFIFGANAGASR